MAAPLSYILGEERRGPDFSALALESYRPITTDPRAAVADGRYSAIGNPPRYVPIIVVLLPKERA